MTDKIIEKDLSYRLGGIFFEIQNELGRFCRERQYADSLEKKLTDCKISFQREFPVSISGRKSNFIDFIIEDRILLDLKAKPFVEKEDYYQMKRYLEITNIKLGLIINFRDRYLKPRRILNGIKKKDEFVDSNEFVISHRLEGFTIIELLVSMGIFLVLMSIVSSGFISSLRTQKELTGLISINDSANLTLEQMMREFRTGYHFNKTFENEIEFVSAENKIVSYKFAGGAIERGETNELAVKTYRKITADNVNIKNFSIELSGGGVGDGYQPRITIAISIVGISKYLQNVPVNVQMTISPRTLDS